MGEDVASGRLVVVGRILAPRGLRGEVRVEVISDSLGRFAAGGALYLDSQPHKIQYSSRLSEGIVALKLEGINSLSDAERLRDAFLTVTEDMVPPLEEGQYYHFQIIDMQVYTQEREYLGQITEILSTGANDVYVVSHKGQVLLIPALDEVIKEIDLDKGVMMVDLPEGLEATPQPTS